MIYRMNGRFFSGLGYIPPKTVTESQRQVEIGMKQNAAWYAGVEKNRQRQAAIAAMSFDELEAAVFMKDPNYGKFAQKFSRDERYTFWVESGKPRQPVPVIQQMNKVADKMSTIAARVAAARETLASSEVLKAASQAVQSVQAANPQVAQSDLVASAGRVVAQYTGGSAPAAPPPVQETVPSVPNVPAAQASSPVAGIAGAGLAAAGLWLLFGG